jgi:hypothetical protein
MQQVLPATVEFSDLLAATRFQEESGFVSLDYEDLYWADAFIDVRFNEAATRHIVALMVAEQLEKDGVTVLNKPSQG